MPLDVGPLACCEMGTSLHQEELIPYHHYGHSPEPFNRVFCCARYIKLN